MKKAAGTFLILCCFWHARAQDSSLQKLKVYIDCSRIHCDRTFIRSEINIVDFVVDGDAADVYVLITAQRAGNGGRQYQLIFYGQQAYGHYKDTLHFTTAANETDAETRQQMTQSIMIGIAPLVASTAYGHGISITMNSCDSVSLALGSVSKDKWNYWVFNIGLDGRLNADKVYKSNNFSSDFSANRTTDRLKVGFRIYASKRHSVYEYEDAAGTTKYMVNNSYYGFSHHLVKSWGPHWSYGYQANFSNNTFTNYKSKIYINPSLEYDIFPYSQVNNRFFVLRYGLDVSNNRYYDTTIYNKIKETLYGHKASVSLIMNQRWGTFYSNIYYRNYFSNWKLNSMGIDLNVDVRVAGGFSFYIKTSGNIVHDQLYLLKGDATEQDVLTRQRQLGSNFNYYMAFGVNFRFGSKFNNFINPRYKDFGGF